MKSKEEITKETRFWKNESDEGAIHYKNGKEHREDGPAVESVNGIKQWWIEGKLHK